MYYPQITSERIKLKAKENKIAIGDLLAECDLGVNALSQAAKSQEGMKARNLYLIAAKLNCSVDYLLGLTDSSNADTSALSVYYNSLNDSGKEKLLEYAKDLAASGRYAGTITVKVAAHGGSAPHEETITKEMAEKLMKAPPQNDKYN